MSAAQLGDGIAGGGLVYTIRLLPFAVSGLSSGVVMVTAGRVRARVVCCGNLRVLGMWARVCVARLPCMRAVARVGRVVMLMSVFGCACGV